MSSFFQCIRQNKIWRYILSFVNITYKGSKGEDRIISFYVIHFSLNIL